MIYREPSPWRALYSAELTSLLKVIINKQKVYSSLLFSDLCFEKMYMKFAGFGTGVRISITAKNEKYHTIPR